MINEAGDPVPFHMVANDGNIMEHTVYFADGQLPTQGIAERYDIVVDFSQFKPAPSSTSSTCCSTRTARPLMRSSRWRTS